MGLPQTLWCAVNEMASGANLGLSQWSLLTTGQIEALEAHAPDGIKALYLPKLIAGEWTGTMCLTESQAGTDVGATRTMATPVDDGAWSVTGQKIYITFGDHDLAENISHLVLARTPDAPPGGRGLSLFLVPKFLPDESGRPGARNGVQAVSLERKMGIHGAPTCVMAFDNAVGWLIGPRHRGLSCMFTMMNNARLSVGMQGIGMAGAAVAASRAYALERVQGRTARGDGPIADHADVRRMLTAMAAQTAAARAVAYACAVALDMARATGDPAWAGRGAFLTPIAKAFGTDTGIAVCDMAVQVHGGMGYVEDLGVAQMLRDVRITAIYEGANGVQAMDLVGRKLADGGAAARALLDEIAAAGPAFAAAHAALGRATDWMLAADAEDRGAGAAPYLRAWGLAYGAALLARGAGDDPEHAALAAYLIRRELPQVAALCAAATDGAATLFAAPLSA
jgi:alkylation response protein AidB-like acyl-CoA dehydrogenase